MSKQDKASAIYWQGRRDAIDDLFKHIAEHGERFALKATAAQHDVVFGGPYAKAYLIKEKLNEDNITGAARFGLSAERGA